MTPKYHRLCAGFLFLVTANLLPMPTAFAQGTAFTYQGKLEDSGNPANGAFDLQFRIFDAANLGAPLGPLVTIDDLSVSNGLFTVSLDFGPGVFTGPARWLNIAVRPGASTDSYTDLLPRQPITATPYALFAGSAPASGMIGTLPSGALAGTYTGAITFNNASGSFAGNGRGLTNLITTNLVGSIPDSRLSPNVALLDQPTQVFTGNTHSFSGLVGVGVIDPLAQLHVVSSDNPTVLRVQSSQGFGAGKVEFWSDPVGSNNEWRPASIVSTDNGGYTGGLAFLVNGTGVDNRESETEVMRLVNGRVGVGTKSPGAKMHVVASSGPTNVGLFIGNRNPFGSAIIETDFDQTNVTHAWFAERGAVVFSVANGGQGFFKGEVTMTACNITSDRNAKEDFKPVNTREVLDKVARIPVSEWQYKSQPNARHIGPMAQDFHDAFALGHDEKHITTVDADGVALAAIQGLNTKLEEALQQKNSEVASLQQSVRELRDLVSRLTSTSKIESR